MLKKITKFLNEIDLPLGAIGILTVGLFVLWVIQL